MRAPWPRVVQVLHCPSVGGVDMSASIPAPLPSVSPGSSSVPLGHGDLAAGREGEGLVESACPRVPLSPNRSPRKRKSDKRAFGRLKGRQVKVIVADAAGLQKLTEGWVCDRSQAGLGLHVRQAFAVGTILSVRADNLQQSSWVQIEVRNCRERADYWLIGCRFRKTPGWDARLQFC